MTFQKGKRLSEEFKKKLSVMNSKENHPQWKGGISSDPDYFKKYHQRRKLEHPLLLKVHRHNSKKNRRGLLLRTVQLVYEENIKKYGTLTCYLCLIKIEFGKDQLEHKTPVSRGGKSNYSNLGVSCPKCNAKKGTKTEEEYRRYINENEEIVNV